MSSRQFNTRKGIITFFHDRIVIEIKDKTPWNLIFSKCLVGKGSLCFFFPWQKYYREWSGFSIEALNLIWSHLSQSEYGLFPWISESFHTRADSKLQWWVVIAIYELLCVHTREKTSPSLQCSILARWEEAWRISVFFWHADCYFIWDRISIYRAKVVRRSCSPPPPPPKKKIYPNLKVKAFIRRFHCVIWEMRNWKTPLDHHWIVEFKWPFVVLICVHMG